MRQRCRVTLAIVFIAVLSCTAQQPPQGPGRDGCLKDFLRGYLEFVGSHEKEATRYSAAFVDLRDDGKQEAIVYLSSDGWCGTGGCTLLILAPEAKSYRLVTRIPAVRLPIRVLAMKSNGWRDVAVVTGRPLHEALLPFDGKSYPRNASMPPARPLSEDAPGKVVMPETVEDEPLSLNTGGPEGREPTPPAQFRLISLL